MKTVFRPKPWRHNTPKLIKLTKNKRYSIGRMMIIFKPINAVWRKKLKQKNWFNNWDNWLAKQPGAAWHRSPCISVSHHSAAPANQLGSQTCSVSVPAWQLEHDTRAGWSALPTLSFYTLAWTPAILFIVQNTQVPQCCKNLTIDRQKYPIWLQKVFLSWSLGHCVMTIELSWLAHPHLAPFHFFCRMGLLVQYIVYNVKCTISVSE